MPQRSTLALLLACVLGASAAQAQPALPVLDGGMVAPPTRVLVLATTHLAQGEAAKTFEPASLSSVLARLQAFAPGIITIEALSGETCDLMRRHPTVYDAQVTQDYCPDTTAAQAATGLDIPAAIAESERLLADWPTAPSAAQRRRLAAVFFAAGDPTSALVQWLQLAPQDRIADDGLDDTLLAALQRRAASPNENTQIAAALAVRLGLQRVYPTDDHTGDNLRVADEAGYGQAVRAAWQAGGVECAATRAREEVLRAAPDLLALYRLLNDPEVLQASMRCDFGAALADPSPAHHGRQYVAGWDLRNLRMVANIGATFRDRAGQRVLSVVGASHKPWFDALLGQMQGVELVDSAALLAGGAD